MNYLSETVVERVLQQVIERTVIDPEFRQFALTRPQQAIEAFSPTPFPADLRFEFTENADTWTAENDMVRRIALPPAMLGSLELSDLELEEVAGGSCSFTCACSGCCCTGCCFTS